MKKIFLLLLIIFSFSFSITFVGIQQSRIDSDIFVDLGLNVSTSGIELINGTAVCSGLTLDVSTYMNGNYSNLQNIMVPCPTFGCGPRPSVGNDIQPFSILIVNKTDYLNNVSYYYNTQYYQYGTGPNPFATFNSTGTYYNPGQPKGDASFKHGMFCYGNFSIIDNGVVLNSFQLNSSITHSLIPPLSKNLSFITILQNCSIFVRTWETDGPMKDSTYTSNTFSPIKKEITFAIYNGPNLIITPIQSDYTVTPGGTVTFRFKLNNSGDMNATISNLSISNGFTVNSFSPSTINAGQIIDFIVTATAPNALPGTIVSPTISFDFNSTIPVVGTCGSSSISSFNVGSVLIGDINPIDVRVYITPSGFFNEGSTFIPSKMNVTARIWREDPLNYLISEVKTNISIYYFNTTLRSWRLKLNIADISGSSGSYSINERNVRWWNNSDGIFINLNETISSSSPFSYVPGVYKVEIRSYDDAATRGSKIQTDSRYFVIFNLPGCARKV
ncbi:MAG: hypothetical protein QXE90_03425 [Candidatus Micrarchaeia archaeon]